MRIIFRIVLFFVQFVAFLAITGISAKAYSYLTAKTYLPGDVPVRVFPVIAVQLHDPGSPAMRYQLVRWSEIEKIRRQDPQVTFKLPQPEGRFALPKQGDFEPYVLFRVVETTINNQLVEVVWHDDDYELYGKYLTDGNSLQPTYFRIWGASTMLVGFIPGLIGGWFVGWVARRKWLKSSDASKPTQG